MKISVLWFCQCKVLYRKPAFSGCKWFIVIYDLPSSFQFPYLDQRCSSDLELVFIVSSGYAIKGKGIQSFSTHSRFVPNHFLTSPYPNSADSHPVWVGSNPKHPMLNIYRLLRGHAYGIFAWVGDVSEIERVRFLIQTIKCENAVQVPSPRCNLFISYILRFSLFVVVLFHFYFQMSSQVIQIKVNTLLSLAKM